MLMPREEVENNAALYGFIKRQREELYDVFNAMNAAQRYSFRDSDPSHLNSEQVAQEVGLTLEALSRQFLQGLTLQNMVASFPDFPPSVTVPELRAMQHTVIPGTPEANNPARTLTLERLKAAGFVQ